MRNEREQRATEERIFQPITYRADGDPNGDPCQAYCEAMSRDKVGDTLVIFIAAPGSGREVYRITRMDETGVYGYLEHKVS